MRSATTPVASPAPPQIIRRTAMGNMSPIPMHNFPSAHDALSLHDATAATEFEPSPAEKPSAAAAAAETATTAGLPVGTLDVPFFVGEAAVTAKGAVGGVAAAAEQDHPWPEQQAPVPGAEAGAGDGAGPAEDAGTAEEPEASEASAEAGAVASEATIEAEATTEPESTEAKVAAAWQQLVDPSNDYPYWWNAVTNESRWEAPSAVLSPPSSEALAAVGEAAVGEAAGEQLAGAQDGGEGGQEGGGEEGGGEEGGAWEDHENTQPLEGLAFATFEPEAAEPAPAPALAPEEARGGDGAQPPPPLDMTAEPPSPTPSSSSSSSSSPSSQASQASPRWGPSKDALETDPPNTAQADGPPPPPPFHDGPPGASSRSIHDGLPVYSPLSPPKASAASAATAASAASAAARAASWASGAPQAAASSWPASGAGVEPPSQVPAHAPPSSSYEVTFEGERLGLSLEQMADPRMLPAIKGAQGDRPRVGDLVESVNGASLRGQPDTYRAALEALQSAGRPVVVGFCRAAEQLDTTVVVGAEAETYEVTFNGERLGLGLVPDRNPAALPLVSVTPSAEGRPAVGDALVSVNGEPLLGEPDTHQ